MKMMCALSMALFLTFGGIVSAQTRCDLCDRIFIQAARTDNMANLRRHLVCSWPNLNAQDEEGKTALMWAITNGHMRVIDFLMNPPSDLRPPNAGTINFNIEDNNGMTALMHAVRTNNDVILRHFLRRGGPGGLINVNHLARNDRTALHFAVEQDMDNMVRILLEQPTINTNIVDISNTTAFMIVVRRRNRNMLGLFAESPHFEVTRSLPGPGMPPLLEAIRLGLPPAVIEDFLWFFPSAIESRHMGFGPYDIMRRYGRYRADDIQRLTYLFTEARNRMLL